MTQHPDYKKGLDDAKKPISVGVSLKEDAIAAQLISTVTQMTSKAVSAQVTVRGPVSAVLDLVKTAGSRADEVSALITLRGDTPAKS